MYIHTCSVACLHIVLKSKRKYDHKNGLWYAKHKLLKTYPIYMYMYNVLDFHTRGVETEASHVLPFCNQKKLDGEA